MDILQTYVGKELEVMLPSGVKVTIREQNGNDDDILSNIANAQSGLSFAKFIAEIITKGPNGTRLNYEQVLNWKVNDLYYLVLASRVHSLGAEVDFKVICNNAACKIATNFTEDLNNFLWDFKKPLPKEGDKDYSKYRAFPYPNGSDSEVTLPLTTGRTVKYKYLTVQGETEYLKSTPEQMSTNKNLLIRDLQLQGNDNSWIPIANFGVFSSREMKEIRTSVENQDRDWQPIMECTCPHCKTQQNISVIQQADFFYPLGN